MLLLVAALAGCGEDPDPGSPAEGEGEGEDEGEGEGEGGTDSPVVINELVAKDPAGGPDWVELYNRSPEAVRMFGWGLSDEGPQPAAGGRVQIAVSLNP